MALVFTVNFGKMKLSYKALKLEISQRSDL